jgi:murein DD-endopeptidase MepM/ murein hydrolase activator NlpD
VNPNPTWPSRVAAVRAATMLVARAARPASADERARSVWVRRISDWVLVMVALAGLGGGCAWTRRPMRPEKEAGQWYAVEEGETLGDVARRAGVPEEDLLEVNGLQRRDQVHPGSLIFVLDGPTGRVVLGKGAAQSAALAADGAGRAGDAATRGADDGVEEGEGGEGGAGRHAKARFCWPLEAPQITSYFGNRWGRTHEGIDLTAAVGTPVLAADAGEVVYAGNKLHGYGNMVVIRHSGDLMTVYAHNSVVLVKAGERVKLGQRVALSGQSGHATGPHLHFEVRKAQIPRDPMRFLPHLVQSSGRSPKS